MNKTPILDKKNHNKSTYLGNVSSRECGNEVRNMVEHFEKKLAEEGYDEVRRFF